MCGIAGILEFRAGQPDRGVLEAMSARLRHRGPDGEGIHISGPCGLVHRRLAILDLQYGAQPLCDTSGTIYITYNGEIYNSPALRSHLEARGHRFRTRTDTEVIVELFKNDPHGFAERLEGIFAFALWDTRSQVLHLARDFIGVKPLYWHRAPGFVAFASEVKALLADHRVPCDPNPLSLAEILAFQNVHGVQSCFREIELLGTGEHVQIGANGRIAARKYWSFADLRSDIAVDRPVAVQQLRELLEKTVRQQLLSDVPVASYLSGGIDTGTLATFATRALGPIHTFSGGFDLSDVAEEERGFDERAGALSVSALLGTMHHFREIGPHDLLDSFTSILWHLEEPRGSTCYAPFVMAREAARYVKVVLSGHGGDELFAGYRSRYQLAAGFGHDWAGAWLKVVNHVLPLQAASTFLHSDFATPSILEWPLEAYRRTVAESRELSGLRRAQHYDLFVYLQGLLLIEDKLSMASGLESRVPLLDRRILEFAWSLPDEWKLGSTLGKEILREAVRDILPAEILLRDKMGFGPPDNSYYRTRLAPLFQEILLGGLAKRHIIRPDAIANVLARQRAGEPLANVLWTLASIELWFTSFFDRAHELRARATSIMPVVLPPRAGEIGSAQASAATAPTPSRGSVALIRILYRRFTPVPVRAAVARRRAALRHALLQSKNPGRLLARMALQRLSAAPRRLLAGLARVVVPGSTATYSRTAWELRSGRYALSLRQRLTARLAQVSPPSRVPLRVFHGLYSTVQPIFLSRAMQALGVRSAYETLDFNPGYTRPDQVHTNIHHPDLYFEQTRLGEDGPQRRPFPVTDRYNLTQLENFFLSRWENYDVFHFNWFLTFLPDQMDVEFLRRSGRQVYLHWRGCFILMKLAPDFAARGMTAADACAFCRRSGWRARYFSTFNRGVTQATRVFVSTPNLCHCSPSFEYLPLSLDPELEQLPSKPPPSTAKNTVRVLHAPSDPAMHRVKGTDFIKSAVAKLRDEGHDVTLELIQNMSRADAVRKFGDGDIFVEQVVLGAYGNTAIEAMAYGMPVISSLDPLLKHLVPGCPIVHADPATLIDRLRELVVDPAQRAELGERCRSFVRTFHGNTTVARHLLRLYEEDFDIRIKRPGNTLHNRSPHYG